MKRQWEIDALRGLMLVLMTLTHLPSRLTDPLGQPFGFVSAAEGFVLLAAYVSGLVYSRLAQRQGIAAMRWAFARRAFKVWLAQAATLLLLFTVIAGLGVRFEQPAVTDLVSYYLAQPRDAFLSGLLLVYEPPLLDILPMYIFFMLVSPWVLGFALRRGWGPVMLASVLLWALAQFGLSEWIYGVAVREFGLSVPYDEMGSFNTFAWQFVWFAGLCIGMGRQGHGARHLHFPWWIIVPAAMVAAYCFVWRHFGDDGQAPYGGDVAMNLLFDKWQLGPLRVINFAALGVLAVRFGPALIERLPRSWLYPLEVMGAASLPVFCAHLVAVLLTLAFYGSNQLARPAWGDALLLAVVFAWLLAVAWSTLWWERRGAAVRSS
ncbi:OpgC domain-containing protein [Variovorax humicola]|uniref:OpgC domain-containing protein n=1 Tax=Variovorax humicola TaxID=1769758 RepID=A0ABU8W1Y6_9BURK